MKFLPTSLLVVIAATSVASLPLEAQNRSRRDRNRIDTEEIRTSSAPNAYDLVKTLRPAWLRTRGATSLQTTAMADPTSATGSSAVAVPPEILVYIDGVRFGTQDSLKDIGVSDVARLEFLDSSAATQRFGTGHSHGAIVIERLTREVLR